jgi:hypothetical protein
MGWTFYSGWNSPRDAQAERREVERLLTWDTPGGAAHMLDARKVGSVWYAAVRVTRGGESQRDYVPALDGSYVFCAVILTQRSGGEWGYKDISETMGPAECRAPELILKLLSPLTDPDGYAAKWRAECRAARKGGAASFKVGDRIRLAHPVTLNGQPVEIVTVSSYTRRGRNMRCYEAPGFGKFRMDSAYLAGATAA